MPNRILREGIIDSERVNSLSPIAEIFYRRLMSKADDYGRFHGHPALVLAALYPLQLDRLTQAHVNSMINECVKAGLISSYSVEGKKYLEIINFGQRVRTDSKFPAPCAHDDSAMSAECAHVARLCARSKSESESYAESWSRRRMRRDGKEVASTRWTALFLWFHQLALRSQQRTVPSRTPPRL